MPPEGVPGTLCEGFERIRGLSHPLARAIMTLFVVTEAHPFTDGNSPTAAAVVAMEIDLQPHAARLRRTRLPGV